MKLACLLNDLRRGELVTSEDLRMRFGISPQLAALYVRNKFLTRLAHGVYCLPSDEIDLKDAINFLKQENHSIHLASQSALAMAVLHITSLFLIRELFLWGDTLSSAA